MIKDRGNIKWGSMMLPEHLKFLREWKQEECATQRELSEWELEELQQTIDLAFNQRKQVKLNVWTEGKIIQWVGIINSINNNTNELILEGLLKTKTIPLKDIYSAQLDNEFYD